VPELPDVAAYVEALSRRVAGATLERIRLHGPFVLRSVAPAPSELEGRAVTAVRRIGKRIVLELEDELAIVVHLMIAGRFRWAERGAKPPGRIGLASFDFPAGTLHLTEAGTKKRAALHLVRGATELAKHDPGGIDVLASDLAAFRAALLRENHTLKRALTDPRAFSGIGNAYSDEILHAARLSPLRWTSQLDDDEIARLHAAAVATLARWVERLVAEARERFPAKVTAFRPGMAVHGKYREPCPVCGTAVQRIVHADSEVNYCPRCQTGGKLLADRALSRLLKGDWPRTIDEWERARDVDHPR
jgi:formamidopyrimidine-DNA glycosylase